jgi:predicted secreted protein
MRGMFAVFALLAMLHLTAADNGNTYTVRPQTAIVLKLTSVPSAGYHWRLKPLDKSVVRLVSHRYVSHAKPGAVGGSGMEIWRFRAVGAGSSRIRVVYLPPGRNTKPARHFYVTINVS